ncbi:tryptophan--tRNA ligase [Radicibacter daui]|uniref:tryptophan--tRNA ligase n=1 Tax=Radicibacter daui TaxID=3064829 RepID=UPI004046D97A
MAVVKRIFSGVQPTGNLHLGNYLGAIRNWVALQNRDEYETIFCIVDLHALTQQPEPEALRSAIRATAAAFVAAGVDPTKSVVFAQSTVPGHAELSWLFSCLTPLGWLNRMTQFKEKAGKHRDNAVLGLYAYPVLMAADILLYRATHVPVGEDQKQHLELARDIAGSFNQRYGVDFFPLPEPQILGAATRVMSLRDGTKKMSKSDESDYSRLNMSDDADTIALKIRKAKTDMDALPDHIDLLEARPEARNLLNIYAALTSRPLEEAVAEMAGKQFSDLKRVLTDAAVSLLGPFTAEYNRIMADPAQIDAFLRLGTDRAQAIAAENLAAVQDITGLLRVR